MFAYSFLAMAGYNIIKPITKSKFIDTLGAEQLPYALLALGITVGVIMHGYSVVASKVPRRVVIPATQALVAALLVGFWILFRTEAAWVSVAFYFIGYGLFGVLLISQFWAFANVIYDPRQAKRLFGFIGGGALLGGMAGSAVLTLLATRLGTTNLLLVGAVVLTSCAGIVVVIQYRERAEASLEFEPVTEKGVGGREALRMLAQSKHLRTIAVVLAFATFGGSVVDQQLNMAAQAFKGRDATDAITEFLGTVQLYTSAIGFVLQVWLTSRLHRYLGIGVALMLLPVSLGATAALILLAPSLLSAGLARVADTSLRYGVDKTTREVLFLPLPEDLKLRAKPFVDVTVDRFGKAVGAFLLLVFIAPWGLGISAERWPQLSYASIALVAIWMFAGVRARRGYLTAFKDSLARNVIDPTEVRIESADLSTIETLVTELGSADERRVLYAIDLLQSLDKRNLITPLLLHHESPAVRARVLGTVPESIARASDHDDAMAGWAPAVERLLRDDDPEVRAAAVTALAAVRGERAASVMERYVSDPDPRIAATAIVALADSSSNEHAADAGRAAHRLIDHGSVDARRELARAVSRVRNTEFHQLLVPLMLDADESVARDAVQSVRVLGAPHPLFVPPLVSLTRSRVVRADARRALAQLGEPIVPLLGYLLADRDEAIEIRREVPAALGLLPSPQSVDLLVRALDEPDGVLRYEALAALVRIRRHGAPLTCSPEAIEKHALLETGRYFTYLGLHYNLFSGSHDGETLLGRALAEKAARARDRLFQLLALRYEWKDILSARWAIDHGTPRVRASATEYLDNLLAGALRKRVLAIVEDIPLEEKVRRGNVFLKTRPRDAVETLAQLIHDDDQIVAAAAIHHVERGGIWSLADDLEYALEHRDPRDWSVFEAASWALAGHRLQSDRRRALWMEPLPAVELADRVRTLPLFSKVSIADLFVIARHGRQLRHEHGVMLLQMGKPASTVLVVLDGIIRENSIGGISTEIRAPAAPGLADIVAGRSVRVTATAIEATTCLLIDASVLISLVASNRQLAQGLFRTLLEGRASRPSVVSPKDVTLVSRARGRSGVDRAMALGAVPLFARVPVEYLLALVAVTREVPLAPRERIIREGERASALTLLDGALELSNTSGTPQAARQGDTIALVEALCGETMSASATVTEGGAALLIDPDDLFDVFSERVDLLQAIFAATLDAPHAAEARVSPSSPVLET